jgi:hypothetical protein
MQITEFWASGDERYGTGSPKIGLFGTIGCVHPLILHFLAEMSRAKHRKLVLSRVRYETSTPISRGPVPISQANRNGPNTGETRNKHRLFS